MKFHGAVKLIPRVCVIGDANSMAPWNLFNKSMEFVQLVVEMIPRHRGIAVLFLQKFHGPVELVSRCCGIGFANQFHIHRGLGLTVLWNWLVKPIPWCRGIGSHIFNNIIIVIIHIIIIMNMNKTQNLKSIPLFLFAR